MKATPRDFLNKEPSSSKGLSSLLLSSGAESNSSDLIEDVILYLLLEIFSIDSNS